MSATWVAIAEDALLVGAIVSVLACAVGTGFAPRNCWGGRLNWGERLRSYGMIGMLVSLICALVLGGIVTLLIISGATLGLGIS